MKFLTRWVRRSMFVFFQKTFNLIVVVALVLQPVGTVGVYGAFAFSRNVPIATAADTAPTDVTAPADPTPPQEDTVTLPAEDKPVVEEKAAPADTTTSSSLDTTSTVSPVLTPSIGDSGAATDIPSNSDQVTPPTTEGTTQTSQDTTTLPTDGTVVPPTDTTTTPPAEDLSGETCLPDGADIKTSSTDDWSVDEANNKAETKDNVKLGVAYEFPLNKDVKVTFTCLPKDTSKLAKLSIEQIKATDLKLPAGIVAVSAYAYDITTDGMDNGSFKYDVTFPKIASGEATISYIEKSADEIKGKSLGKDDVKEVDKNNVENKSEEVDATDLDHFTTFVVTQQSQVSSGATIAGSCMEDAAEKNLQCTANDISLANVSNINVIDGCDFPGDTTTFEATWDLQSTATERYDIGLYFATGGQTSALTGDCSVSTLPNSPTPPWNNLDADTCGDTTGVTLHPTITITAQCSDPDGNNQLNLPYCTSWDNNAGGVCSGPADAIPGTGSKCNCQDGFQIPIVVPFGAKIEVKKVLNPSNNAGKFNLQVDGSTAGTGANVGDGGTTGLVPVTAGTSQNPGANHTVGETNGTTTSLGDYTSSISCVDRGLATFNGGAPLSLSGTGPLTVHTDKDDDIVCTITNTLKTGTITIVKDTVPNDAQDFAFTTTGTGLSAFSLDDDADATLSNTKTFTGIIPGSYTVAETALAGSDLTNLVCVDPTTNSTVDLGTRTATINLATNETVTCTFTNTKKAHLVVQKTTFPAADPTVFSINASGTGTITSGGAGTVTDATDRDYEVTPGTYSVAETMPAGWTKTVDTCQNVVVAAGQTVNCLLTNAKDVKLTLVKTVTNNNGGAAVTTDFQGKIDGNNVAWGVAQVVTVGAHTASETNLAGYTPSVWGGNCATNGTITLAAGDNKTCTITNDDIAPSLTLDKVVANNNVGTALESAWTLTATGADQTPTNLSGLGAAGSSDVVSGSTFKADTYTLAESTGPVGYSASTWTCTNNVVVTNSQITLGLGQNTVCTVTNTRDTGTLQVLKNVDLNGDGDYTDQGETGATNWLWQANGGANHSTGDPAVTVGTGDYGLTETGQTNFHQVGLSCNGGTLVGNTVTVAKNANVICAFTNARDTGNLKAVKVVDDQSVLTQWSFALDGGTPIQANANGEVDFGQVTTSVTHTITEVGPTASYQLLSVSGTNCARVGSTLVANATVVKDGTTVCTFSNVVNKGTITIIKNAVPDDIQDFSFTTTGNGLTSFTLDDDGDNNNGTSNTKTFTNLFPGTYGVVEGAVTSWDLTSATCSDGSPVSAISVSAGETVTCTFTNTKRGNIIVEKQTSPDGAAGNFTFTGTAAGTISDNGQIVVNNLVPGTYTSTETSPSPAFALTGLICDDGQSTTPSTINVGTRTATFKLDPGETIKCTFTNTEQGTLTLVKNTIGGNGAFNFTTTGGLSPASPSITTVSNTGSQVYSNIVPGTYSFAETVPVGWDLTSAICSDGSPVTAINISAGESVTCTFTNTKRGSITIVKDAINNNAQDFVFNNNFGNGHPSTFSLDDDSNLTLPNNRTFEVFPGTYAVSENSVTGWQQESATCGDGSPVSAIAVAPGETVTCTFVNEELAKIILVKNTVGGNDTFDFDATGAGLPTDIDLTTVGSTASQTFSDLDQDNTYSIAENAPAGWDQTSATCTGTNTPESITPDPGETVICTFTNTKRGHITIKKVAVGGDDSFTFTGDIGGVLSNNQTATQEVVPGTYTSTEAAKTGWDLTNISCSDTDSTGVIGTGIATFHVAAGEDVTCTYTNTKRGNLTLVKNTIGADGAFDFTTTGGLTPTTPSITTVGNTGNQNFSNILPGTYSISETVPTGWDLTSATCSDQSPVTAINIAAGENVTCTFTNTKRGTVIVTKYQDENANGVDDDEPGLENFQIHFGDTTQSTEADGNTTFGDVLPGTYDLSETAPVADNPWILSDIVCQGENERNAGVEDPKDTYQVSVNPGETVNCFIGNYQKAHITVVKDVVGPNGEDVTDTSTQFNFNVTGQQNPFPLTDNGSQGFDVNPGSYDVTEDTSNANYTFVGCNAVYDNHAIGSPVINGESVTVGSGDTVTVTCTNKQMPGTITGLKWNDLNENHELDCNFLDQIDQAPQCEPKLSDWTIFIDANGNGTLDDGEVSTTTDQDGNYSLSGLAPGTYRICEVQQDGWNQTYPQDEELNNCHQVTIGSNGTSNEGNDFGNHFTPPALKIEKFVSNDGGTTLLDSLDGANSQSPGDSVTYILKIKAAGGDHGEIANLSNVNDVHVTDLPPAGFVYHGGSWTANSTVRGDIKGSPTTEPTYPTDNSSSGVWSLGDMVPGEVVTLTYVTDISNNQDAGLYKDLAWSEGTSLTHEQVLATVGDPELFVGTQVAVVTPTAIAVQLDESTKTDTNHRIKRVLGASLPATGANVLWMGLAVLMLVLGLGMIMYAKRKKSMLMNHSKGMLTKALFMFILGVSVFAVPSVASATTDPHISVRIETPKSPSIESAFRIGFVTLDIDGRDLTAQCYQVGSPAVAIATVYTVKSGGNSGYCNVNVADGSYQFYVRADAEGGYGQSETVNVDVNANAPSTPLNYNRVKNSCTVTFTTANDGLTAGVELYRSTDISFVADASTYISTLAIGPNTAGTVTDATSDCGGGDNFYAIRAISAAGAGSPFVGDENVTVKHKTNTTTKVTHPVAASGGAIPVTGGGAAVGGGSTGTEGTVQGAETENNPQGSAVLGEETAQGSADQGGLGWIQNHPWWSALSFVALLAILSYLYRAYQRNKHDGNNQPK